jgi:LytS/YehU family sensor histidine kinase
MAPVLKHVPDNEQFLMAVKAAFVLLPPKLLIVYYLIQAGVPKILNDQLNRFLVIAEICLILLLSLILFRAIFHYVVYPKIYLLPVKIHFFNARNTLIAVLEIGYITGIAITLKLLRLQTASKEREKNLVNEKLGAELKFLRNQTNPHFLFNTLNNIYALARKKSDDTAEAIMKLSKLLRFMLYESGKDLITITQEIKILDDYLELEKIRYNERLAITFHKEIDNNGQTIAPLLLLPFIENAFKHGVSETRFNSHIYIDLKLKQGRLSFQIENSKENGNADTVKDSIGLSNVRRQLELMYKEYSMEVKNGSDLFKVQLTINLDSHAKI